MPKSAMRNAGRTASARWTLKPVGRAELRKSLWSSTAGLQSEMTLRLSREQTAALRSNPHV